MKKLINRFIFTIKNFPVELFIALLFFMLAIYHKMFQTPGSMSYTPMMPIFFGLTFILNKIFSCRHNRVLYYLLGLLPLLFLFCNLNEWIFSAKYFVTLIIVSLAVTLIGWKKENDQFIGFSFLYLGNFILSLFFMSVSFGLILAIFNSIAYIFNIFHSIQNVFSDYLSYLIFILLWPITFLILFDNKADNLKIYPSKIFNILLNYIVSPAILIYTVILYIYFGKIAVLMELPKGMISIMVFWFLFVVMASKACLPFLKKNFFTWYYNYFTFISLPALIMFWIGTFYRVSQYGVTQERVYLLICGVIMTLTLILFSFKRSAHFVYAVISALILFAIFTYIPGITAKDLGICSQIHRIETKAKRLNLLDDSGKFKKEKSHLSDSTYIDDFKQIYSGLQYIRGEQKDSSLYLRYGMDEKLFLKIVMPDSLAKSLKYRNIDNSFISIDEQSNTITYKESDSYWSIILKNKSINIEGFSELLMVSSKSKDRVLFIKNATDDKSILEVSYDSILTCQLNKLNIRCGTKICRSDIKFKEQDFLYYDIDSLRVIFQKIAFKMAADSLKIDTLEVAYCLKR